MKNTPLTSTEASVLSVEDRRKNRQRMKMVQWVSWAITIVTQTSEAALDALRCAYRTTSVCAWRLNPVWAIHAPKLQRHGEAHANVAYGVSTVTLDLIAESDMEQIVLE